MVFQQTFIHFCHLKLYHVPQLAWFVVFLMPFSFEYFDPFDHFATSTQPMANIRYF